MAVVLKINNLFVGGITIYPFILIKSSDYDNLVLINHEKIHIRQQLELLVFPFYLIYFSHYLYNLGKFKNHKLAYRNIIFEKEAFKHDTDLKYLDKRKLFGFVFNS